MVYIDIPLEEVTQDLAREALTGRVAHLSPSAVLALMERGAVPELDAHAALRDATGNRELDALVRAGAIRTYLHVAGTDAVPVLSELLGSDEQRVAVAAATALGQVGTADQLQALRELRERTRDAFRQRVVFAEALIVHRYGLTDEDVALPEPEAFEQGPLALAGGRPFRSTRPGPERKRRALVGIKRDFPNLDVARQDVYEIQCGPRLMAVAVDTDAVRESAGKLGRVPAMPSVIALQDPEYGEYSSAFVLLSRPIGRNRVTVQINRLGSGEALYTGAGKVGGEVAMVDLRTSNLPGVAPIDGRVWVTSAGVEIFGASEDRVLAARNPQKGD